MPPESAQNLLDSAATWTRSDWLALCALVLAVVHVAWTLARRWRSAGRANAVKAADVLDFAMSSARYS
jgi:hypothetical protein